MDGDAPNAMGSPELEDHDAFVIESVCCSRERLPRGRIRPRDRRRRGPQHPGRKRAPTPSDL